MNPYEPFSSAQLFKLEHSQIFDVLKNSIKKTFSNVIACRKDGNFKCFKNSKIANENLFDIEDFEINNNTFAFKILLYFNREKINFICEKWYFKLSLFNDSSLNNEISLIKSKKKLNFFIRTVLELCAILPLQSMINRLDGLNFDIECSIDNDNESKSENEGFNTENIYFKLYQMWEISLQIYYLDKKQIFKEEEKLANLSLKSQSNGNNNNLKNIYPHSFAYNKKENIINSHLSNTTNISTNIITSNTSKNKVNDNILIDEIIKEIKNTKEFDYTNFKLLNEEIKAVQDITNKFNDNFEKFNFFENKSINNESNQSHNKKDNNNSFKNILTYKDVPNNINIANNIFNNENIKNNINEGILDIDNFHNILNDFLNIKKEYTNV